MNQTEAEMRDAKAPTPDTVADLSTYINKLVNRQHDYGTCCYAMSLAATAAFNFVAHKLGVTGFQASCADMDILRRTRHIEGGFRIMKYDDLLYPQYCDDEHFPSWRDLLKDKDIAKQLAKKAKAKLKKNPNAHEDVVAHWRKLAKSA